MKLAVASLAGVIGLAVSASTASATVAPNYTFSLTPVSSVSGSSATVEYDATITNNTDSYVSVMGSNSVLGTISPYVTLKDVRVYGASIAPNSTKTFDAVNLTYADAPGGDYTALSSFAIYLGYNFTEVDATNAPTMIQVEGPAASAVSAAPEPGAWALMLGGIGMLGAAMRIAHARRREHDVKDIATA